jgi:SAM-dependent methyltransferase
MLADVPDDPEAVARRRLHASLTDPNCLVLRARRKIFTRWAAELPSGLTVLDIGGRYQPYRPLLESKLQRYIAIDLVPTRFVTVQADGENLPFRSESFDLVIVTQVFEYLPRPDRAAAEILRVLKPGGLLFLSAVAFAPRFVDEELWRFTGPGLHKMFAAFSRVEVTPEASSFSGLLRSANLAMAWFAAKFRLTSWLYAHTLCPALNLIGLVIEKLGVMSNDQFAPNYSVRAVKG